jgi:diguanylate cyclase (GGDEF)-like protein/PAS domain S-box-containing protein
VVRQRAGATEGARKGRAGTVALGRSVVASRARGGAVQRSGTTLSTDAIEDARRSPSRVGQGVGTNGRSRAGKPAAQRSNGLSGAASDEERLRCIIELASEPFLEVDARMVLTEWNAHAEELLGWRREEVVGRRVVDFLIPATLRDEYEGGFAAYLETLCRSPKPRAERLRFVHRDGHELVVSGLVYGVGSGEHARMGGFIRDHAELRAAQEALARAYLHDSLTGLPNRTLFNFRLDYVLAEHREPGHVAVLVVDLDRFRGINDALGHEAGDEVLMAVAARLTAIDGAEVIGRLGGDEFLVLFYGEAAEERAVAFAEGVRRCLEVPIPAKGTEVFVSASVGIAATTPTVRTSSALLSNADAAMHEAKKLGGGTHEVFGEALSVQVHDRMEVEQSLHRALERGELTLFYQPVVEINGGRPVGVEALLRWQHPEHGLVGPDKFIPVAEESGLIIPIGTWVLEEACRQLKAWQSDRKAGPSGAVEVNLSARQIDHPEIVASVERILQATGIAPVNLTLEVTESALMRDAQSALEVLRALKELGVTLAIDDFGTGYSSLSYLRHFPLDILKIDKTFVDALDEEGQGHAIVAAVVNLAHALGLRVIAEGVETEHQLEMLQQLGCDFAQGYLFSRPVPAEELASRLAVAIGV